MARLETVSRNALPSNQWPVTGKSRHFFFKSILIRYSFFTYGSFPLADTLAYLNDHLSQYDKQKALNVSSALVEESRWQQPRSVNVTCSPQSFVVDPTKTTTVSVSYLLGR